MKILFTYSFILVSFLLFICHSSAQTIQWAKKGVSQGFDNGNAIVTDDLGNVYVTGQIEYSAVFDSRTKSSNGGHDILVAKYDADGVLKWIQTAGGPEGDVGNAIGIDASYNTYVTGEIENVAQFGSGISLSASGANDIFLAKYDLNGQIQWAKKWGTSSNEKALAIKVTASGDCYITGYFSETLSFDGITLSSSGNYEIFIVKTNSQGVVQWAKKAGGSGEDRGLGIAVDLSGNVYVTGRYSQSANFSGTTISNSGSMNAFLAKYNSGGSLQWVRGAGACCGETESNAIALDENDNIYITGQFTEETNFGSSQLNSSGLEDVFISKYNSSGNILWTKKAGGSEEDIGLGITVDVNSQQVFITGSVRGSGNFGSNSYTVAGFKDVFVAAYDYSGNNLWLKVSGGGYRDVGRAISVNYRSDIFTTGLFNDVAHFDSHTLTGYPNTPLAEFFVNKITVTTRVPIILAGENFKYLDNGSNQGTVWRNNSFNDSSWPQGQAALGFGNPVTTTIFSGPLTYYFRKSINIPDPATFSDFTMNIRRDDGIVVYVNGVEVYRNNMPGGTISYNTPAASTCSDDGNTVLTFNIPATIFNAGNNVVAAEVHNQSTGSSDVTFYLEMFGNSTTATTPNSCSSPDYTLFGTTNITTTSADVSWSAVSGAASYEVAYRVRNSGASYSSPIPTANTSLTLTGLSPQTNYEFIVRTICPVGVSAYSFPGIFSTMSLSGSQTTVFISSSGTFKYLDNGSNQGTAWRNSAFSDASWAQGQAALGFGNPRATTIATGHMTYYFRKEVSIPDPLIYSGFTMNIRRDDGIVVYINGAEVYRNNMPSGTINYNTPAASTCSDDGNALFTFTLPANVFASGNNVIAAEVHNRTTGSSDVTFLLELIGNGTSSAMAPSISEILDDGFAGILRSGYFEDNEEELISINIYPNPVVQHLNIEITCEESMIIPLQVFNLSGQLVFERQIIPANGSHTERIDISEINKGTPGVYLINIKSKDQNYSRRFVIQ